MLSDEYYTQEERLKRWWSGLLVAGLGVGLLLGVCGMAFGWNWVGVFAIMALVTAGVFVGALLVAVGIGMMVNKRQGAG